MITDLEARALRTLTETKKDGMVRVEREVAAQIHEMLGTPLLVLSVTAAGYQALRDYDKGTSEVAVRRRLAEGMSEAARRALPPSEKGERDA